MIHFCGIPVKIFYDLWNDRKFHSHPDITYKDGIGYIDDFRSQYLPATHAGSRYNPFCKPVIATMPGMKQRNEAAYNFFVKREIYLINSKKMFVDIALETVFLTAFVATTILTLSLPVIAGIGTGLFLGYLIVSTIRDIHYESKADLYAYENSTDEERREAYKWIKLLQARAKQKNQDVPFNKLGLFLETKVPEAIPGDNERWSFNACCIEHDERPSMLGLGLTVRPPSSSLTRNSAFYKREQMHFKAAGSDILGYGFLFAFIGVVGVLSPALLMSPIIFVLHPIAYHGFERIVHLATDAIFKWNYDKRGEVAKRVADDPKVYQGAYWKWRRGAERSPSLVSV